MFGKDGRLYDRFFDYDGDGKLSDFEMADMIDDFDRHFNSESADCDELDKELEESGLDFDELEFMDEADRRDAFESAGLDYDDYSDEF